MYQVCIKKIKELIMVVLMAPMCCFAAPDLFVEGQDYTKLPESTRKNVYVEQLLKSDPNKVQVLMFFSFACHGCEVLHKPFTQWAQEQQKKSNNKVAIHEYPVAFNAQWQMLAKMYYVLETLNANKSLNTEVFTALHKNGIKLWEPAIMKKFFVQHGFTAERFDMAYNSFSVKMQVNRADEISKAYGIVITPVLIINGPINSYKVDFAKAGNDVAKLIKIINYLVSREVKLL